MSVDGITAVFEQGLYSPSHDTTGRSLYIGPKGYPRDGSVTGVIYCHAYSGTEQDVWSSGNDNLKNIVQSVAKYRPTMTCTFGGDQWGNDAAIAEVTDAYNYLVNTYGAKPGKVGLMFRSMGHVTAANWARANKALTAFIAGFEGVSDINNFMGQSGANATAVNSVYGGAYSDATYGAAHNPNVYAGTHDLDGIPWRNYYATDDTTVPPSTVTALAAKISTGQAIAIGTGGHSDAPLANVDLSELLSWIKTQAG